MANIALDEKDNHICGNCYLHSNIFPICILTGEDTNNSDTCDKWMAERISDYNEIN
jgi:hypothetical protein